MDNKAWSKRTNKELQAIIREKTKEVNVRLFEYRLAGKEYKDVEQAIRNIKNISGVEESKEGFEIGTGSISRKSKAQLIRQARELNSFLQWDISTPEGRRQLEAREQKEWKTFQERPDHKDWTYDEWRDVVETMGALGKDIIDQFGSDNIIAEYEKRTDKGRISLLNTMRAVLKESKGKSWTPEDLMDALREHLDDVEGKKKPQEQEEQKQE
jgi:hypothetical protein